MKLIKDNRATYNDILIDDILLSKDFDGSATLHLMNNNKELLVVALWLWYNDVRGYSADYLLCDIQGTPKLELIK